MAQARYQYGTSPRKIDPDYERKGKKTKKNEKIKIVEDLPRQQIKVSKQQKKKPLCFFHKVSATNKWLL